MTILNLEDMTVTETTEDNNNIFVVELTVTEARVVLNELEEVHESLVSALDKAQGEVYTDNEQVTYLVIKITR